ncbi:hypothetical protein DP117_17535 [Brasilonema sp. UFV-L1]|nr:hypothetical protein [Brasilonema sp. UFV-L1]
MNYAQCQEYSVFDFYSFLIFDFLNLILIIKNTFVNFFMTIVNFLKFSSRMSFSRKIVAMSYSPSFL